MNMITMKMLSCHLLMISGEPGMGSDPTQRTPSQSVMTVSNELNQSATSWSVMELTSLHLTLMLELENCL